jgi:VanZ family protein
MEPENQYPELNSRARQLWLVIGWLLVLLVIFLSLAPISVQVPVEEGDKLGHVAAYATLMLWFANLYETLSRRIMLAIGFVALGIALEFVQGWTGYRTFEVADMAADALGVAVGWALAPPRLPNFLQRIEKFVRR